MNISSNRNSYIAEININAMVGIALVLLITFMISSPTGCSGESVVIPKTINAFEDQKIAKETAVIISIPTNDEYYIGAERLNLDGLTKKIKQMRNHTIEGNIVYIKGGSLVNYGSIANAFSTLRNAGIRRIGLVTNNYTKHQ